MLIRALLKPSATVLLVASGLSISLSAAQAACTDSVNRQVARVERLSQLLRPDKPSQMRVSAPGRSDISGGQAYWLRAEVRKIESSCSRSDDDTARALLAEIDSLWGPR